ncbi:MAG: metallophosphoesterase family protein [Acidimicrobiales bacterium]
MAVELTTVADDEAVFHVDGEAVRYDGLRPDHPYEHHGVAFRTLPRPAGARLATVATVNDLHFGEVECGRIDRLDLGPVLRSPPGAEPYPAMMSAAAVAEISALGPDAVVAKGDLTAGGSRAQFDAFLDCYGAFGERLHYVRGNHDVVGAETFAADAPFEVVLPGVSLAVIDTAVPGQSSGSVDETTLRWLDELGARADRPVLVLGHHHAWLPDAGDAPGGFFGIEAGASQRLADVVARRPALVAYLAGHTHRNRVVRTAATGAFPWVEVACVKDYPGTWAEYRVFEGGILQVHRRISSPGALAWSEAARAMFGGFYPAYALGTLHDRCFPIGPRAGSAD